MIPTEQLLEWLTAALVEQPGWVVQERQPIDSFQQVIERVVLTWPGADPTAELFVRVYRGYMSWWTLTTPDLPQREQTAWRVAERAGVPVPRTLYTLQSPDTTVVIQRSEPGASDWRPSSRDQMARLAEIFARLHAAPVQEEDRAHLPDVSPAALLPRMSSWAGEAGDTTLQLAIDTLAERLARVDGRPAGFLHGDCHLGNILAEGEAITAVIDWEEAALGDPRLDVAEMDSDLRDHSVELADHFLACYQVQAALPLGPLQIWLELTRLRDQVVSAWVKHSLAEGRRLPTANPEIWIR